ncbi:MAG TPA: hypothetical protein VHD55_00715 [Candidatus Paceibacterota bacterium]|nr:hypothetical protein [Candidatus Paceibacterota bacterium]
MSVYLDLGGALAAFGLLFTVYQLRRPRWEVILRIRNNWQSDIFWILGFIGLFYALVGVLVSELPINSFNFPFNTPLLYEVAAYLSFVASPLSLIYFATNDKKLFNAKTAETFYEVILQEISKSSDVNLDAALEIVLRNFNEICDATLQNTDKDLRSYARSILDVVLSDESVVKVLTTKRLDALQYIFYLIKEKNITRAHSGIGIPRIVNNLFFDENSFLYKQLDRKGLALSSNIYTSIFESPVILTNFDLFGYPTIGYGMSRDTGNAGIRVFIKALSLSIETYFKTGSVPPRHINNGLSYLSNIFGGLCAKIAIKENKGVDTKSSLEDEWWGLHQIASFLGHDYIFLAYEEKLNQQVLENEKTAHEARFGSNATINEGIAAVIYKAFEQLSQIKKTTDIYHTVLELLHGMMNEPTYKEGYRPPFEKRLWQQIGANVAKRYYPAVVRTYLTFVGFCLGADANQRQGWIGEQAERMRRLLYIDLKPLFDKNEKMINKEFMKDVLLPDSMSYKDGKFTYTSGFGEGTTTEVAPPPEGATSGLEGIDLESMPHFV